MHREDEHHSCWWMSADTLHYRTVWSTCTSTLTAVTDYKYSYYTGWKCVSEFDVDVNHNFLERLKYRNLLHRPSVIKGKCQEKTDEKETFYDVEGRQIKKDAWMSDGNEFQRSDAATRVCLYWLKLCLHGLPSNITLKVICKGISQNLWKAVSSF